MPKKGHICSALSKSEARVPGGVGFHQRQSYAGGSGPPIADFRVPDVAFLNAYHTFMTGLSERAAAIARGTHLGSTSIWPEEQALRNEGMAVAFRMSHVIQPQGIVPQHAYQVPGVPNIPDVGVVRPPPIYYTRNAPDQRLRADSLNATALLAAGREHGQTLPGNGAPLPQTGHVSASDARDNKARAGLHLSSSSLDG